MKKKKKIVRKVKHIIEESCLFNQSSILPFMFYNNVKVDTKLSINRENYITQFYKL